MTRGIRITTPSDDRLERMMADPAAYFAEARRRAREVIQRDMDRERRRRG